MSGMACPLEASPMGNATPSEGRFGEGQCLEDGACDLIPDLIC